MTDSADNQNSDLVDLAGDIVSAYVANNSLPTSELAGLIRSVHAALARLTTGVAEPVPEEAPEKATPAQIRKSVTPAGIVSFLDGKTYKTLKRHLTGHGLDPHSYRQRYGLPADYPMVAPDYAAQRSALAKSIGLGRVGDRSEAPQPTAKGRGKAA
ncbi:MULTISPECIES: MucR family transcriptional regulator [unclassified Methylobacterium]|jgi:predicted transcriptional regulator|uniref:MucR family transcriptional regulator n=1 Tax=unclassified Methylobacterium TaxID=2615210 RepID=UPI0006F65665|nr:MULTISPECIES: MucR family transcriptional regulator [unclassified Methylobacterium]KQO63359.1 MucR family transcriptional regulator [Methylobacterium sp. Leaf88]KQT71377.1 MucR family transcriptional regulator [Methylobacterium sp. Leaf465]KQU25509.1 MucR family transcriptional regulator [Methylobacterium sp. Leaf94]